MTTERFAAQLTGTQRDIADERRGGGKISATICVRHVAAPPPPHEPGDWTDADGEESDENKHSDGCQRLKRSEAKRSGDDEDGKGGCHAVRADEEEEAAVKVNQGQVMYF